MGQMTHRLNVDPAQPLCKSVYGATSVNKARWHKVPPPRHWTMAEDVGGTALLLCSPRDGPNWGIRLKVTSPEDGALHQHRQVSCKTNQFKGRVVFMDPNTPELEAKVKSMMADIEDQKENEVVFNQMICDR
ncbi:unnamed protein product [Symbiodinium natans]|uniref:Uncharacterized protein n=1 Tax=Symbiodinium natans TaxID=878477 RepID=A0A812M894_9DINO|nr:unnamed protein product [Symbiodinium natans]